MTSAQIYKKQGDYLKAIGFYEKEVANHPDNALAFFELGQCYQMINEYGKMANSFEQSLKLTDKYYEEITEIREELWSRFFNDGVPLFNEGKYQEALAKFDLAVTVYPENIETYKERGLCYLQLKQYDNALNDFDRFIVADTVEKDISVRINRANILYLNKRFDEAVDGYLDALKIEPLNIIAISKLALIYQEQGKAEKAVEMYEKAIIANPKDSDLWFNMGILYFNMKNFVKAKECFNKVVEMNPEDVESLMNLVNSLWKMELYGEAIPFLEKVVALKPDNVTGWQFLFVAYNKESTREDLSDAQRKELVNKAKDAFDKYKALGGGK
jgi:tetratricopeptide (TPR) repeat protein